MATTIRLQALLQAADAIHSETDIAAGEILALTIAAKAGIRVVEHQLLSVGRHSVAVDFLHRIQMDKSFIITGIARFFLFSAHASSSNHVNPICRGGDCMAETESDSK